MSESQSLFKVYFEGFTDTYDKNLHLTFISIQDLNLSYSTFPNFLRKYNELSRKKGSYSLKNISQVISYGGANTRNMIEYYVVLFTQSGKNGNEKIGYLLGKNKQNEYHFMGSWPFDRKELITAQPSIPKKGIEQIFEVPDQNSDILLVT